MLLIVGCSCHSRDNSKDSPQAVIRAIDCVSDPASATTMPALSFEDIVQCCSRASRPGHCVQDPRVSLLFNRDFTQELPVTDIAARLFATLLAITGLVAVLRSFHSANRNISSSDAIPPAVQATRQCIWQDRGRVPEFNQSLFPALSVALFGFRHTQQDTL